MRTMLLLTTAVLALTACGPKANTAPADANAMAMSDNMTVPPSEDANVAMTGAPATESTDSFLTKAAMSDMYEIASSKLAATHASSADVKKFASQMVAAHTATTKSLKAAIAKDNVIHMPPAALDAEHQALIDALTAAKGADFDTLYKTQQIDAHTKALAVHQGYAAGGEKPALKAFAADTAPKVQSHLAMLKAMS